MSKPVENMTDEQLIKKLRSLYPYNDKNIWSYDSVITELENRGYDINEHSYIQIEKDGKLYK